MRRLTAAGIVLTGLSCLALGLLAVWSRTNRMEEIKPLAIGVLAVAVLVYFAAVREVLHPRERNRGVWMVLIVALALRLPLLFAPPFLSSDIYRYVWDGRVQAAGFNPYSFVPADPALAALRDDAIYPYINRAGYAHTIYPPAAQIVFAAVGQISQTVLAEKLAMAAFEALAIACGLGLLRLARLPSERLLIYAWNPLAVWSFACDGHVDAAAIGLLAGALLLRCRGRDGWAGVVFGAAVLIKFLPLAIGPALWRRGPGWRLALCGSLAILVLYACYAGAGWGVLGFLPGYRTEEGIDSGRGVWLLAGLELLNALPAWAAIAYGGIVLSGLAVYALWIMTRPPAEMDVVRVCGFAAVLMTSVTAAISPHYPWYFAWLALPAIVTPSRVTVWLSAAPMVLYLTPSDSHFVWPSLVYAPALVLALADLRGMLHTPPIPAQGFS